MGRKLKTEWRVLGPYRRKGKLNSYIGFVVAPSGDRQSETFCGASAEKDADDWATATRLGLGLGSDKRVSAAIEDYERYRLEVKGNRTVSETTRRLKLFFPADTPLKSLDRVRALAYYNVFSARVRPDKKPISVDYQRNTLAEAKTFLRWCVDQGWLRSNPLEGVKGRGKRRHGKPQLRIDEARKWEQEALRLAAKKDHGAIASLLTLYCGLRASEITHLRCRDLDDGGSLLWVGEDEDGRKTEKARRQLAVPLKLRPLLLAVRGKREGDDYLWGELHWRNWPRTHVRRICDVVGVPQISAHGMRGLHASLAAAAGLAGEAVSQQLGHERMSTTKRHYSTPEAQARGQQNRALTRLGGGNDTLDSVTPAQTQKLVRQKRV